LFSIRCGGCDARLLGFSPGTGIKSSCKSEPENRAEHSGNERRRRVNTVKPLESEHHLGTPDPQILTLANPRAGPLFTGLAFVDLCRGYRAGERDRSDQFPEWRA